MKKLLLAFFFLLNIYPQWISNTTVNNPVSITPEDKNAPKMVTDGKNGAIIFYMLIRNNIPELWGQRILKDATASWGPNGKLIYPMIINNTTPYVIPDGSGGVFLAWSDRFYQTLDICVQHIDSNGNFLWQPGGIILTHGSLPQQNPVIVSDNAGGILVFWESYNNSSETDIWGQHILYTGAIVWQLPICTVAGNQENICAVPDGNSGAVIGFTDYRTDHSGDIYANHILPNGLPEWGSNGMIVCNAPGVQSKPFMFRDNQYYYFIWKDMRNGSNSPDIYGQILIYGGAPMLPNSGLPITNNGTLKDINSISFDINKNLSLVYNDYVQQKLFLSKLNLNLNPLWPAKIVANNINYFSNASITLDDFSQPTVVWMDSRTGDKNIYAQKFDVNGLNFWTSDGVVISNAPGDQIQPVAVKSEKNVIIAWQDFRANISAADIYASMLSDLGNLTPVELTSFSAAQINNAVKIDFITETENNCKGFEVEKSANDIDWKGIGFIKGAGSSTDKNNYSFLDYDIKSNQTYYFRLKQIDNDGTENFSEEITLRTGNIANSFALSDNYPNPFNPSTTIEFNVPVRTFVQLNVYDVLGNLVNAVVNEVKEPGNYKLKIDGSKLSSGVYYYQIKAGDFLQTKKMILLK